jgi:magnesium chelatase family protein
MLVGTMNPAPDGKMPRESGCWREADSELSGPDFGAVAGRIDLHVEVAAVKFQEITSGRNGESLGQIRERVLSARQVQQRRYAGRAR